jgi:hypothetical protein
MSQQQAKTTKRQVYRPGGGHLLDAPELAKVLGESQRTIRTWTDTQIIPHIEAGFRTKRYSLPAVLRALEKRTVKAK